MGEHPCQQHPIGQHTEACRASRCGYCGTDLRTAGFGECRACRYLVCAACDGRYLPELGPICGPCTPPPHLPTEGEAGHWLVRMCVFDLSLSCGHIATVARTGWYPVSVSCCDRLGGSVLRGRYHPYDSDVDYVEVVSERCEQRPTGTPHAPTRVLARRARTDNPYPCTIAGLRCSTGRYPAHVGATHSWDGSQPEPPPPRQPRRPGTSPPAQTPVASPRHASDKRVVADRTDPARREGAA